MIYGDRTLKTTTPEDIPSKEVSPVKHSGSAKRLRPKGTVKHPLVALPLASGRIVLFALRHGAKPMRVDYRTGDVWLDSG